jgi:hypothetical protein
VISDISEITKPLRIRGVHAPVAPPEVTRVERM